PVTPSEKLFNSLAPIGQEITIPASANCSTIPQTTVAQRMRERLRDRSVAKAMITARPMRPVKRSTRSSSPRAGERPAGSSVRDLVFLASPLVERHERLGPQQLLHRKPSLADRPRDLAIDEIVVEVDPRGVLARGAEVHVAETGPVDGREAHRARLAARVQVAVGQLEGPEAPACLA